MLRRLEFKPKINNVDCFSHISSIFMADVTFYMTNFALTCYKPALLFKM